VFPIRHSSKTWRSWKMAYSVYCWNRRSWNKNELGEKKKKGKRWRAS